MEIKSYFDILKVLGKPGYENVSASDKGRHLFMINRHLSRMYPEIAARFSHMKTDPKTAMDFWHFYFKTIRAAKKEPLPASINFAKLTAKSNKRTWSDEAEEFMTDKLQLGTKELKLLKQFNNDGLIKYLEDVDSLINEKIKK